MQRDLALVVDIVLAAREIAAFTAGFTQEEFACNSLIRSAVCFQLQIIGEAAKRLSIGFRVRYPSISWRQMAGMRDRLIHGYDQINLDLV